MPRKNTKTMGNKIMLPESWFVQKRWKSVTERILSNEQTVVNFSDIHNKYYLAYSNEDDSVHYGKHRHYLNNIALTQTKRSTQAYERSIKWNALEHPNKPKTNKTDGESTIKKTSHPVSSQQVFGEKWYKLDHWALSRRTK